MKNIIESLNESIVNEGRELMYRADAYAIENEDGDLVSITISIDAKYKKQMEQWLKRKTTVDDEFARVIGVNTHFSTVNPSFFD